MISNLESPKDDFLSFVRSLSNNSNLHYSTEVASSEKEIGFRNVALCNFIKSFGNIENDPTEVLDFYFDLCSLEMNCQELSEAFLFLAKVALKEEIAVHPNQYTIAVWSPKLNKKGNSYKGIRFLEDFTTKSEFSIF